MPIQRVVQPTSVANLDLLTTGPQVANPAELLMTSELNRFLDEARSLYDVVIIDSSPILAVTDPSIIGANVDAVLLVVSTGTLRQQEAERTMELLNGLGTPILGVAINQVNESRDDHGYGYGYGYGTYGNEESDADLEDGDFADESTSHQDDSTASHATNGRADVNSNGHGHH
jgi:capsular exopolysaccharide synthesis family protein